MVRKGIQGFEQTAYILKKVFNRMLDSYVTGTGVMRVNWMKVCLAKGMSNSVQVLSVVLPLSTFLITIPSKNVYGL